MANKPLTFCKYPGCSSLVTDGYCAIHTDYAKQLDKEHDRRRGTAQERGYTYRWSKYSQAFLRRPENQFCKLHLDDKCNIIAQCVDHITPVAGRDDPNFWKVSNHQSSCIHCNSVKGHRVQVGTWEFGSNK